MARENVEIWHVLIASSLRYLIFAGIAYLLFYVWKRRKWIHLKIQKKFPKKSSIRTELLYSLSTAMIFGLVIYTFVFSPVRNYTRLYDDIHEHSAIYFIASVLICVFAHDTYFYWMHRLMHWKPLFPYVHHIHHKSHNPTPLAAFAFHPFEALIEIGVLPLLLITIPLHMKAVGLFGLYMIVMNVTGHLGYELYPEKFGKSKLFRFFNTSTHHNMHHHYGKGNYGLYFNLWDRLMGTNHMHYQEEFDHVTRVAKENKNVVH